MNNRGDFGSAQSYGATRASYHSGRDNDTFNNLCDNASSKIFLLNKNVSKLESLSKSIDSSVNEKDAEEKIHTLSQNSNKLATETKNVFKEILEFTRSGRYEGHDNRQGRYILQQNKLRKEYENSLSRYHAIQNVLSFKMKANIEQEVSFTQDTSIDNDQELLGKQLIVHDELDNQVQIETEVAEAKERQARLTQIEEDMLNVNDIFRDLAFLVHEQGQVVDSIESNIEQANILVGEGNQQLLRAKSYQKSARKRMCYIALICIIVAIVLILIIYYSTKS